MLVQTSDATWQAYNAYGGNSLYTCTVACPPGNPTPTRARSRSPTTGRSTARRPGQRALVSLLRRVPDDPVHRAQRLRRELHEPADVDANAAACCSTTRCSSPRLTTSTGRRAQRDERRGGARRRREPRVLQRQRGVLEDALGVEQRRRHGHASTARWSTYKETHCDAPTDPVRRGPAPGATRASARPPTAGDPENALTGQLFIVNSGTSDITVPSQYSELRLWRNTAVASLARRPDARRWRRARHARLRVGRRCRQRLPARRAQSISRRRRSSGVEAFIDYGTQRRARRRRDAPPDAVPGAERRARLRRRHRAVVVGPRQQRWSSPAGRTRPTRRCSRRRSTCSPTWACSPTTLMRRLVRGRGSRPTPPRRPRRSPSRRPARRIADGTQVTITGTATDTGGGVVAGVEVSTDGGATWHRATGTTTWTYTWIAHGAPSDDASRPARSTTAATSRLRPRRASRVNVGCPCTLWGRPSTPRRSSTQRRPERGRARRASSGPTSTARSPASASTRRPPTPARTSATCGPRAGRCSRPRRSPARRRRAGSR